MVLDFYFALQRKFAGAEKALEMIDRCIEEEPSEVECHYVKRRICKHAGDLEGSISASYAAQDLDLSDR